MDQGQPSRVNEETSCAGGTGSIENPHVQNGPSCPPQKLQPTPGVQCARSTSDGAQRLRIRILRSGKTRTFAPAPAQHNTPFRSRGKWTPIHGAAGFVRSSFKRPCGRQPRARKTQSWKHCKSSRTGRTHAGRRGLSVLTNAACRAAVEGSAGSLGEAATNASVQQHRDVGAPRSRPQHPPISHHLTTIIIISPDCTMRPPLHNLYVSAARFSSNQSLSASLCTMSSWRSPMHFRVHAACRTAVRQSKEDERQWDWTSTVKRSGEDSAEREHEAAGAKRSHSAPAEADMIAATERSRNQADR